MSDPRRAFFLRAPWRVPFAALGLVLALGLAYGLWKPGADLRDGSHDKGRNAIWIGHAWLGDEAWFLRNGKQTKMGFYRDEGAIRDLAANLKRNGIRDVYPHLCPSGGNGELPGVDDRQVARFLDHFGAFRVLPWVGGVFGQSARIEDAAWRERFCRGIASLLARHPRLAGIHLNVEPCPSGNDAMIKLLQEIRAVLPPAKILSVAAYPPPTLWQRSLEVHWEESYFRSVAARADQLVVMMYDTGIPYRKPYVHLMAAWTREVLAWSEGREVLLGLPAYDDAGTGWHDPAVENLETGLAGIHAGLGRTPPGNYAGVALYSEWEMDSREWDYWAVHFLRSAR
jgi:hypothetical protein